MYKDRFRPSPPKSNANISPNTHPQLFIRQCDIAYERERVKQVEHVCRILIESRFGPDRTAPFVIHISERHELDEMAFFDLCDNGVVQPCRAFSSLGHTLLQVVEAAFKRAKQIGLLDEISAAHRAANASPNQGRGSP